ncbi:MAG: hypothetical protein UT33_C0005G0112 [Candidatus Peregrinibacteria bacterium GW2011_GWC2_39_14]|nr:MAG: hypothetical protein US92_C0001G0112 [Candidatus Peregrinibacteria bacterium GW2011_GWA2_38_36]KKR07168.1 MAG: hypothetical protein UT33_C0005G0112 [Candidatus Peregrinibacteria bacterium GW2011_GWC2_39_14]
MVDLRIFRAIIVIDLSFPAPLDKILVSLGEDFSL